MSTNKNLRYQTSNTASVLGLKDAHNTFVDNVARLNFKNLVKNSTFSRVNASNVMYDWTANLVTGTYNSANEWFVATYGNQGFIEQIFSTATKIQLKPNTVYSAVFYGSASATGMVFEITSTSNYQVYDINDTTKTQSASAAIEVSGTNMVKHMLSFRTNTTTVSGDIYIRIKSSVTAARTCYLKSLSLYEGLVEIDGLPSSQLPTQNQTQVTSGTPYSTIIFDETGIAVSAAQRAQSADKLYNVGGATETTVNDTLTSTAAIWTSSKTNTTITNAVAAHAALTAAGTHGSAVGNTPNTIVHRNGVGDFAAGTITATLNGRAIVANLADIATAAVSADKLDGYHLSEILAMIPSPLTLGGTNYMIANNTQRISGTAQSLYVTIAGVGSFYIPASSNACGCTCTCECECTCPCQSPCDCWD